MLLHIMKRCSTMRSKIYRIHCPRIQNIEYPTTNGLPQIQDLQEPAKKCLGRIIESKIFKIFRQNVSIGSKIFKIF